MSSYLTLPLPGVTVSGFGALPLAQNCVGLPGSPLPPLSGRLTTPTLDIGGAILEGVDVRMHDPALDTVAP